MGTVTYTFDLPNPHFDIKADIRSHSKTRFNVWVDENKVTISESKYLTGINHRNIDKKRWWRWRSMSAYGFMRTKTGLAQPFEVNRANPERGREWRNVTPVRAINYLTGSDEIGNAYKEQLAKVFGFTEFNELYPMAQHFGITKFTGMPLGIRRAFRERTPEDFTRSVFGVKRLNDNLVSAVSNADPYFITLAQQFRGFVPDSMLVDFLKEQDVEEIEEVLDNSYLGNYATSPLLRKSLRVINPDSHKHLISEEIDRASFESISQISMCNTTRRFKQPRVDREKVFTTFHELSRNHYW